VEIGDLVRLKETLNYSSEDKNILGVIVDIHKIASATTKHRGIREEYFGTEYKVNIITNNKSSWYFEDNLELVCEGWRLNKEQSDG